MSFGLDLFTSAIISIIIVMFANFRFVKEKREEDEEDKVADRSVEIVRVVEAKEKRKSRALMNIEVQYPVSKIWRGPLVTRGPWMESKGEYFRYMVDQQGEEGDIPIRLEGWIHDRTYEYLLAEYGRIHSVGVCWDGWVVKLNVIACNNIVPVEDMPRVIECGENKAFVTSNEAFDIFKETALEAHHRGDQVTPGKKLLFHTILNRDEMAGDLVVESFACWPASVIFELIESRRPGEYFETFSMEEAGLKEGPGLTGRGLGDEALLQEVQVDAAGPAVEAEKEKQNNLQESPLPPLIRTDEEEDKDEVVRHDTDLIRKRKGKKRGRGRWSRKPRKARGKKEPKSPVKLTADQERWLVSQLVLGVEPGASAERIEENYQELLRNREERRRLEEEVTGEAYGSAHGGWRLSCGDLQDIMEMRKRSATSSSVLSPRGELSQNLGSTDGLEDSGPALKRRRRATEGSSVSSLAMSPFLAMRSSGGRVVSITSTSSEGLEEPRLGAARMNLSSLLESGRLQFPEDGILSSIQVEVFEENEQAEDGDHKVEKQEKVEDPSP